MCEGETKPTDAGALVEQTRDGGHDLIEAHAPRGRVVPADLKVLAIDALQIAVREEYVADAALARYDGLLAAVKADRRDLETAPRPAIARAARRAIGAAFARAASHACARSLDRLSSFEVTEATSSDTRPSARA